MMRTLAFLLVALTAAFAAPEVAECSWCPTYTCFGPCGMGCACIAPPGTAGGGKCYSVQHAERMIEAGAREVR
jgi:hypothetical protein